LTCAVGFLVAYDYDLLKCALPLIYKEASYIVLALDKDCRSFSGNQFEVSIEFFEWVKKFDIQKKILWNRGDFYQPHIAPLEVETLTRNRLFDVLTETVDWYVQLDSDEYFIDFNGFKRWLSEYDCRDINAIKVYLKSIFKQGKNGFYTVGSLTESVVVACRKPLYQSTRHPVGEQYEFAPFTILHQSWARKDAEVQFKLSNWGHKNDLAAAKFYKLWSSCNQTNYRFYRYFHPLHPPLWPFLEFVPASNIETLIKLFEKNLPKQIPTPPLPTWYKVFRKIKLKINAAIGYLYHPKF
jgi:hypothetical protein